MHAYSGSLSVLSAFHLSRQVMHYDDVRLCGYRWKRYLRAAPTAMILGDIGGKAGPPFSRVTTPEKYAWEVSGKARNG